MRTHGHRKGSTKHWGLLGGNGEGQLGGRSGGLAWGEMPNVGEGEKERKAHCHLCSYATVFFFNFYWILDFGVHEQSMQDSCVGTHMAVLHLGLILLCVNLILPF